MKKIKKLLSLVLAMMLVLGMGSSVMASGDLPEEPEAPVTETKEVNVNDGYLGETGEGSLTISNGSSKQTYTIFKMFDLVKDGDVYYYTVTDEWKAFVDGEGSKYVKVNTDGYVTWNNTATASNTVVTEAFAKAALDYVRENNIAGQAVKTEGEETDSITWIVKFNNLPLGYYLLDSSMGTLCSLDTAEPNATITEKNKKPTVDKEVQQPTASVGDVLDYDVTIEIAAGAQDYKLHDKMSAGLTFDPSSVTVKLLPPNAAEDAVGTDVAGYILTTEGLEDGCTFEITFAEGYCEGLETGSKIVISYQATINEDAVVGVDPVKNTAILDFGDDNHQTSTPPTEVTTDLYDLEITKIDGANKAPLTGAEFSLETAEGIKITFTEKTDQDGKTYYVASTAQDGEEKGELETITITSDDGKILIKGLAAGKYNLTEIKAPTGYNKLQSPIEVEIKEKTVSATSSTAEVSLTQVTVENNTGAELPSTGGIGTTIFYVLGGILVVGACIMLVVRKRMSSEE